MNASSNETPSADQAEATAELALEQKFLSAKQLQSWLWVLMFLGVAARLLRYLLRFPLWEDEAMLSYNLIDGSYAELMKNLDYHQVAPLLFLWAQSTVVRLLGFHEYSLRLLPFLCSLGSLFLFRHVAGRLLRGTALLVAVGLFAVAYPFIRYAAEAKPYGCDLMVSLGLLALFVEWLHAERHVRWLWMMVVVTPLAVLFSYPSVFMAGGLSLTILFVMVMNREKHNILAWVSWNVVLVGSFALLFLLSAGKQAASDQNIMAECWAQTFPPLSQPLKLIPWLIESHCSDLTAYPVGGGAYGGLHAAVCCVAGLWFWKKKKRWDLVAMCLAPLAVNMVAAAVHRYPYGGHVRFSLYASPLVCLTAGLGVAVYSRWLASRGWASQRSMNVFLSLLMLVGLGCMARDLTCPYKSPNDQRARDFARYFWPNMEIQGEAVCLLKDWQQDFSPDTFTTTNWSALYFCNQKIYSPRHALCQKANMTKVSQDWPLRCVLFQTGPNFDKQAFANWLQQMGQQYELTSQEAYPLPIYAKRGEVVLNVDHVKVYKFVPKTSVAKSVPDKTAANIQR